MKEVLGESLASTEDCCSGEKGCSKQNWIHGTEYTASTSSVSFLF